MYFVYSRNFKIISLLYVIVNIFFFKNLKGEVKGTGRTNSRSHSLFIYSAQFLPSFLRFYCVLFSRAFFFLQKDLRIVVPRVSVFKKKCKNKKKNQKRNHVTIKLIKLIKMK